jgi:hypothetical protein
VIGRLLLICSFIIACGGDEVNTVTKSKATTGEKTEDVVAAVEIDFVAEDKAINQTLKDQNAAISGKELDDIMVYWVKSESKDIFTAWTFWAGTFEKNEGWKAVKNGWVGIFKLRAGEMTVEVLSLEIDSRAKNSVLHGKYKWGGQQGELLAAFQKKKDKWQIRAIDFTNGRFGKQIKKLQDPAYKNPQ